VDGVNVSVRLGEDPKLCLLVVIGVREDGEKELLAVEDGYRESEDSWSAVFRDLRDRGLGCPKLVTGDGARECRRNRVSVAERTSHAHENSQHDRSRRCCQRGAKRPQTRRAERGVSRVAGRSRAR
jgi:hypothetical protein